MRPTLMVAAALVLAVTVGAIGTAASGGGASSPSSAGADSLRDLFTEANELYTEGDFEGAERLYLRLEQAGVVDKDLYYNLGNTYYRLGRIGKAVLYYRRAQSLAPRDEDLKANLKLLRSLLRDEQFLGREGKLARFFLWFHRNLSRDEAALASSGFFLASCLLALLLILLERPAVGSLYRRLSILSPGRLLGLSPRADLALGAVLCFLLAASFGGSALLKTREHESMRRAVVVVEEALVYSAPSEDSTLQFKIHEGTEVTLGERRGKWVQVNLPGGLSGWMEQQAAERI